MSEVLPVTGNAEDKQAKEYGRMVVWAMKHWSFIWKAVSAASFAGWVTYNTIQTLKAEMVQVKSDVSAIRKDVVKMDEKIDRLLRRR